MQIEEILIIKNAHESYGISTEDISQISRVPMLMPLPLRPVCVRGLCAVSGNIITMVDMNLLLGLKEVDCDADKSRIVILNEKFSSSTLLVTEVYNTIEIDQSKIDYIEKENDPVIAIYKYKDTLVQIISLNTLFSKVNNVSIEAKEISSGKIKNQVQKEEDVLRYLIFMMEKEYYAVQIDFLSEIILADVTFTDIAGSSNEVLGLITLREELLLVVDLREHYGLSKSDSDKNRILIVSHKQKKIGLLVDEIVDIKNFETKRIEPMDEEFENNKIAGIIHDENENLITYFDEKVLENLFEENNSFIDTENTQLHKELIDDIDTEVIIFKLSDKEYAFNVDSVAEIIDNVESTSVAYTEDKIDGIINIRGQIIAIVSLCQILGIEESISDESKIIVCVIKGIKIGFIVDSVSDILGIKEHEIREQEDQIFSNIFHLENGNRLVLSMDIDEIARRKEVE